VSLFFFNYLSRKTEEFKSVSKIVGLYTCGPTVYDFVHIGNWRTFVFEDVLKRVLIFNGYKVKHVMNLTDIDDKIINKTQEQKISIDQLTNKYADAFMADLGKLNIVRADVYPRAREPKYIAAMIDLIGKIIQSGVGYIKDGSVYFSINKFKNYGKLSGTNIKGVKAGARVDVDEYDKEDPQDFVLWKASDARAKEKDEAFDSPWGIGRPGWHIECSAMSMLELGKTFDIHTGGVDLLFPHHENEIAQSEAATGKKFVNFWMEGEHLQVEGEKMAKRLGNIYTLEDIIKKGFEPLALRYLFLTAHYRSKLNFTWESLSSAQSALENVKFQISNLKSETRNSKVSDLHLKKFKEAISNDLDMPKAIAILHEVLKSDLDNSQKYRTILEMDKVFGLGLDKIEKQELPKGAKELIDEREEARKLGDFAKSDKIRTELAKMGVSVEDTVDGPKWKVKKVES